MRTNREVGGALSPTSLLKGGTVVYNGLVRQICADTSDWPRSSSRGGWETDIQLVFDGHLTFSTDEQKRYKHTYTSQILKCEQMDIIVR